MSKTEILKELDSLTPEDRQEIRARLDELDDPENEEWASLSQADKELIEERIADFRKNPHTSIPGPEAEARLMARFRK